MSTATRKTVFPKNDYPTSDGRPMAETDWHRILMTNLIAALDEFFAAHPMVYVSGNLLLFYEEGNRRRPVSPDVFVVKGVPKTQRPNYLVWQERKGPDIVIELTSSSTRAEDIKHKYALYQDRLRVKEYFLFDPLGDYLTPQLKGYRLNRGKYGAIVPVGGRLPSNVLDLHLEPHGRALRLWNPAAGTWLPTPQDRAARAEEGAARAQEEAARAEAENERLRRELEKLRRRPPKES